MQRLLSARCSRAGQGTPVLIPVTGAPGRLLECGPETSVAHLVHASSNAVAGGKGTDGERGLREAGRDRGRTVTGDRISIGVSVQLRPRHHGLRRCRRCCDVGADDHDLFRHVAVAIRRHRANVRGAPAAWIRVLH